MIVFYIQVDAAALVLMMLLTLRSFIR